MIRTLVVLFLVSTLLWVFGRTREHIVGSSSGTGTAPATAPNPAPAPAPVPAPAPAPAPSTTTVSPEFQQLLDTFKAQYLEYKMTGSPASRAAYEAAQTAINTQLTTLQTRADTTATNIQTFVDEYVDANPELVSLHSQLKAIRRETPSIENRFEVEKRTSDAVTTVDISMYYLKGFITLALLAIVGVVSLSD